MGWGGKCNKCIDLKLYDVFQSFAVVVFNVSNDPHFWPVAVFHEDPESFWHNSVVLITSLFSNITRYSRFILDTSSPGIALALVSLMGKETTNWVPRLLRLPLFLDFYTVQN